MIKNYFVSNWKNSERIGKNKKKTRSNSMFEAVEIQESGGKVMWKRFSVNSWQMEGIQIIPMLSL